MKNKSLKKLIFPSICAVAALFVLIGNLFAFFMGGNQAITGGLGASVIQGSSGEDGSIDITLLSGGEITNFDDLLEPGGSLKAKITITNTTASSGTVKLRIKDLTVFYPTAVANSQFYLDKHIDTENYYYVDTGDPFELLEESVDFARQSFFRSFVSPATNAVMYELYTLNPDAEEFHEGYSPQYLTSLPKASTADFAATNGARVITERAPLPLNINSEVLVDPTLTITNGGVYLTAGRSVDLYLLLKFDESFYSTSTYNTSQIELRNSNPFMEQNFYLIFDMSLT